MITAPDRVTCPRCAGKRVIVTTAPNLRKYGGVEYVDAKKPEVERLHVCPTCDYRGTIAAEHAAIDADIAAFEATLDDYDAHARERIAAGLEPW